MQENKFENRVRQEMDEFRIRPSGAVWEKVEEELKKKRRRRVAFYFFILAGLGLITYSGLIIHDYVNLKDVPIAASNTQQVKNGPVEDNIASPASEKVNAQTGILTGKESQATNKNISILKETDNKLEKKTIGKSFVVGKKEKSSNQKISKNILPSKSINKDIDAFTNESVKTNATYQNKNQHSEKNLVDELPVSDSGFAGINSDKDKIVTKENTAVQNTGDSLSKSYAKADEETPAAKVEIKQVAKIKWALELSAGMSAYRDKVFSIYDGQKSMDRLFSSPGNSSGGAQAIVYPPSSIQPGLAFRAGISGEMKISKRSSISSGIRYAYNSNRILVGTYTFTQIAVSNSSSSFSSSVNNFYRGIQQKEYTNQFHFIQVPVQYHWQVNKGVKLPIILNAGIAPSWLFSTNGLVYDTVANGIYFQTKKAYHKIQLDLHSGLSFVFGNKSKIKWSVGPEVSLGLNKLTKTEYTRRQYLLYSGIRGKIFFSKKKK